jgi:menaquinone-9 beta-reductase
VSPVRATARGAQRTSLDGERADVVVCGASFAGLATARALAGSGLDVLVVDRYEIGERATSACATPEGWLHALGLQDAIRQVLPDMTFTTPHGSVRYRLPWRWAAFDYRALCEALWAQCDGARFETAKVEGRSPTGVRTDRGELHAPRVVDALGWKRVLGVHQQPPDAPNSRGLEVHPHVGEPDATALDCWVDRSLVRRGYAWRVPAGDEQRVGVGSYDPRRHVKDPTLDLARRLDVPAERFQGNWFAHRLRTATDGRTAFVGDSAGHCFPLSGEGIRTAFHFGAALGEAIRDEPSWEAALRRYARFHAAHRHAFELAWQLQRLVPALPPRVLTAGLRAFAPFQRRAFAWYLRQAPPPGKRGRALLPTGRRGRARPPVVGRSARPRFP